MVNTIKCNAVAFPFSCLLLTKKKPPPLRTVKSEKQNKTKDPRKQKPFLMWEN